MLQLTPPPSPTCSIFLISKPTASSIHPLRHSQRVDTTASYAPFKSQKAAKKNGPIEADQLARSFVSRRFYFFDRLDGVTREIGWHMLCFALDLYLRLPILPDAHPVQERNAGERLQVFSLGSAARLFDPDAFLVTVLKGLVS